MTEEITDPADDTTPQNSRSLATPEQWLRATAISLGFDPDLVVAQHALVLANGRTWTASTATVTDEQLANSLTLPGARTTENGLRVYASFTDRYGAEYSVQESTLADERAVWLGDDIDPGELLNIEQARIVRDALTAFIEDEDGRRG